MKKASKQAAMMRARGYITPREAAERLGISTGTIYRWVDEGHVAEQRLAGARYVEVGSLTKHVGPAAMTMLGVQPAKASGGGG